MKYRKNIEDETGAHFLSLIVVVDGLEVGLVLALQLAAQAVDVIALWRLAVTVTLAVTALKQQTNT